MNSSTKNVGKKEKKSKDMTFGIKRGLFYFNFICKQATRQSTTTSKKLIEMTHT